MNQLPQILYSKLQQIDKFIIINAVTFFLNLKRDMILVPCWIWERNNSIPHSIHSSFSGILNAYNGNLCKTVKEKQIKHLWIKSCQTRISSTDKLFYLCYAVCQHHPENQRDLWGQALHFYWIYLRDIPGHCIVMCSTVISKVINFFANTEAQSIIQVILIQLLLHF